MALRSKWAPAQGSASRLPNKKFLFLVLLCSACASQPLGNSNAHKEKNIRALRQAVLADGNIAWNSAQKKMAAAVSMAAAWPNSLRLEIQDPFGGRIALLLIHGENFWWESQEDSRAYTGTLRSKELKQILPWPVLEVPLVAILLLRSGEGAQVGWNERFQEPSYWQINSSWRVNYNDYQISSGQYFPAEMRILAKSEELIFRWQDWQTKADLPQKIFQIPPPDSIASRYRRLK